MATYLQHDAPIPADPLDHAARADRPTKRRRRTVSLLIVDVILFATFLLVINVPLTGLTIHEWLGILIGAGFIVHLLQHGEWIATTTRRFLSASSFQNRANYLLTVGLFIGFVSIIVSGLLISEVVLPWLGFTPGGGTFWLWIHLASVGWVIWLTAIHIAMNWRWIAHTADRFVFKPISRLGGAQ